LVLSTKSYQGYLGKNLYLFSDNTVTKEPR